MKSSIWDVVFIVFLTGLLLILLQTDKMWILTKLPFITIYAAYIIGRYVGYVTNKKAIEKDS